MVTWALSFATEPHRDAENITGRVPLLDPSARALMNNREERSSPVRWIARGL